MMMPIIESVTAIIELAKKRNWKVTTNFVGYLGSDTILIARLGIEKYKREYQKNITLILPISNYNYNSKLTLEKIDKWLVECIRKEIPETKKFRIKLGSSKEYNYPSLGNTHIGEFPPEK